MEQKVENIFAIPEANMPELRDEMAKLNKRAAKLGTAPLTITEISNDVVTEKVPAYAIYNERGDILEVLEWREVARNVITVQIDGETPMLNGWRFAATLIHSENGTMINRMPSFEAEVDLTQYRDADPSHCDHCGLDRRRVDTFVVYNAETGETKQVGRQCLKDFLGYNDPLAIAKQLERIRDFFANLRSGEGYTMHGPDLEYTVDYLTHVAAMIRLHGWVSRKQAEMSYDQVRATSVDAYWNMIDYGKKDKFGNKLYEDVTDEDREIAKAAFEWNQAKWDKESDNEFEGNMAVAFASEWFNTRTKGFVAYGVQAYLKDRTEQLEREAKKDNLPSEWQGEVGKRETFYGLTVTNERTIENEYEMRTSYLYTMIDKFGNVFKWFASRPALEVGKTYNLKATVKKHDEWKGTKQTVINRAKEA